MKRNIITSTINWWANSSLPIYFFILLLSTTACKKKTEEFTVKQLANDGNISTFFTDTTTVIASTVLINDSLVTNKPTYLMFGNVLHPDAGLTQVESYFRLIPYGMTSSRMDFTGAVVDSALLYFDYSYVCGDTTLSNNLSVHELTTALDPNFPYRANTSFVTYNSTELASVSMLPKPRGNDKIKIPLSVSFGQTLLNTLDDATADEFVQSFNGLMVKGDNVSSVITVNRSSTSTDPTVFYGTSYLVVYYKMAGVKRIQTFSFPPSTASFNKITSDKTGTLFAGLQNSGDELPSASTANMVLAQAGTGTFIKVKFPNLSKLTPNPDSVIVVNKAYLRLTADTTSMSNNPPVLTFVLSELTATNELMFRGVLPALVQYNGYSQTGTGYPVYMNYNKTAGNYIGDITDYVQNLMFGTITSEGIALVPNVNSYFVNYTYSSTVKPKKVSLELYYTVIKQ